jgi:hypothetical protein
VFVNFMMSILFAINRYIYICHLPQSYARISICHQNKLKHFHSGVQISVFVTVNLSAATFRARWRFFTIEVDKNTLLILQIF